MISRSNPKAVLHRYQIKPQRVSDKSGSKPFGSNAYHLISLHHAQLAPFVFDGLDS